MSQRERTSCRSTFSSHVQRSSFSQSHSAIRPCSAKEVGWLTFTFGRACIFKSNLYPIRAVLRRMCQASLTPFSNQWCWGESKTWCPIATAIMGSAHCTGPTHWLVGFVAQACGHVLLQRFPYLIAVVACRFRPWIQLFVALNVNLVTFLTLDCVQW